MKKMVLDFRMTGDELVLNYSSKTEKCKWGIFNTGRMEMSSGILSGKPPHHIPVNELSPDIYQLCVIDGDVLVNAKFRVQ